METICRNVGDDEGKNVKFLVGIEVGIVLGVDVFSREGNAVGMVVGV